MAGSYQIDDILLLLAIRLAQPGQLSDIVEAYERLEPPDLEERPPKPDVKAHIDRLVAQKYAWMYTGRRYMLTRAGDRYLGAAGLRLQLDARRLYLLKETRKRSLSRRSDARDWPLKQQS